MAQVSLLSLKPDDENLEGVIGERVASNLPDTTYQVIRRLGEGGMASVFLALREDASGVSPAVLKILSPRFVVKSGTRASLSLSKEALALKALNEQLPPSPFVVRMLDNGTLPVLTHKANGEPALTLGLGWIALEYIHGDAEGSTLVERVGYSIERTGAAFEPLRAMDCIHHIAQGLSAVHQLGMLHRDLKPANILCAGFGEQEQFKIADFGIARSLATGTFLAAGVGTPGYTAPEQLYAQGARLGPPSDIFGLAALSYFILTGKPLFFFKNPLDMVHVVNAEARPSIRETDHLSPELKANQAACDLIDVVIKRATSANPSERQQTATCFHEEICSALLKPQNLSRTTLSRLPAYNEDAAPSQLSWQWLERQRPFGDGPGPMRQSVVVSSAFDGRSACLATTPEHLIYWNGSGWHAIQIPGHSPIISVARAGLGEWLVASRDGGVHCFSRDGLAELAKGQGQRFELLSGVLRQMVVLVNQDLSSYPPKAPPSLHRLTKRGFLDPTPLPQFSTVNSIARLDTARWVVAGRNQAGEGSVAIYRAFDSQVDILPVPKATAYLACATDQEHRRALVVGTQGAIVWLGEHGLEAERLDEGMALSAAALDPSGGAWVAATGGLLHRPPGKRKRFSTPWQSSAFNRPFTSLYASAGVVMALTADGAILEGFTGSSRGFMRADS